MEQTYVTHLEIKDTRIILVGKKGKGLVEIDVGPLWRIILKFPSKKWNAISQTEFWIVAGYIVQRKITPNTVTGCDNYLDPTRDYQRLQRGFSVVFFAKFCRNRREAAKHQSHCNMSPSPSDLNTVDNDSHKCNILSGRQNPVC